MEKKDLINSLLQIHADAQKKYENANREGDEFNIFQLIKDIYWIDEPKHSRFISFLLNPNGIHGQKDVYLNLFLDKLGIDYKSEQRRNWSVLAEKDNVDILIQSNYPDKISIVIENKCYDAVDQESQLYRYWYNCIYNFHQDNPDGHLNLKKNRVVYLPKGSWKTYCTNSVCRTDDSLPDMNLEIITSWTIEREIDEWLSECLEVTTSLRIKKFIEDYQTFWRETNLKNLFMTEAIINGITNVEQWKSLSEMIIIKNEIQNQWITTFTEEMRSLADAYGWSFTKENDHDYRIYRKDKNKMSFCFEYYLGLTVWDDRFQNEAQKEKIKEKISSLFNNVGNDFNFIDGRLNGHIGYLMETEQKLTFSKNTNDPSEFAFNLNTENIFVQIQTVLEKYLSDENIRKSFYEWSNADIQEFLE